MTVTVHFTIDDVRARVEESTGREHFALTPSAFLAARRAALNPRSTLGTFSDWGHARCAAAGRRAAREFNTAAADWNLPASVGLVGEQAAMRLAFIARRIVHSLPVGAMVGPGRRRGVASRRDARAGSGGALAAHVGQGRQ